MTIITIRYPGLEITPAPRPKPTKRGKHCGLYNPPEYTKYMDNLSLVTEAYLVENGIELEQIMCDYLFYEFGVANLGKDNDNSIKGIQDAVKQCGFFAEDNALHIPLTTIAFFPVDKTKVFTQLTIVHDGDESDYERFRVYRDKREKISLELIKGRRK